jgi:peroxiredoxin
MPLLKTCFFIAGLLFCKSVFSQYEAECFMNTKKEILFEIENMPNDTLHFHDTIEEIGSKRYLDTTVMIRGKDVSPLINKIVGCRMPDFPFSNLDGKDFSINGIKSDFMLVYFSFVDCGDVCNAQLKEFSKLKTTLKDSLTVINIFPDSNGKVREFAKDYESNIEFIANADLLTYNYSFGGTTLFVLDKYKNIIYVKNGAHYVYSPSEIYFDLLEKMRGTKCSD